MEWPDPKHVQDLLNAGGLSGAEDEILARYLSLPVSSWQQDQELERLTDEDGSLNDADPEADGFADDFPTTAMVRRVNQILQNRR